MLLLTVNTLILWELLSTLLSCLCIFYAVAACCHSNWDIDRVQHASNSIIVSNIISYIINIQTKWPTPNCQLLTDKIEVSLPASAATVRNSMSVLCLCHRPELLNHLQELLFLYSIIYIW